LALLSEGLLAIEVYAAHAEDDLTPIVSFPCELDDLRRVLDIGGTYRASTPEGHLLVRPSGENIWFVYGVNDPVIEDSCLLPKAELEDVVAKVLASSRTSLL
jgi:hypothetical protein